MWGREGRGGHIREGLEHRRHGSGARPAAEAQRWLAVLTPTASATFWRWRTASRVWAIGAAGWSALVSDSASGRSRRRRGIK